MHGVAPIHPGSGGVPAVGFAPVARRRWLNELIAAWGFALRNYYITKRYVWWELVWFAYTTANAMSIGFIGAGAAAIAGAGGPEGTGFDTPALTTWNS